MAHTSIHTHGRAGRDRVPDDLRSSSSFSRLLLADPRASQAATVLALRMWSPGVYTGRPSGQAFTKSVDGGMYRCPASQRGGKQILDIDIGVPVRVRVSALERSDATSEEDYLWSALPQLRYHVRGLDIHILRSAGRKMAIVNR